MTRRDPSFTTIPYVPFGLLLVGLLTGAVGAQAEEPLVYDQIDLSAEAQEEVANDLFVAVLYVEQEGQRQADVAARVNTAMEWGLGRAKAVDGVKSQTLQYSTYPVYAKNSSTITGWRARQSLRLESRDAKAMGDLIAELQEKLAVQSVGYGVSREARKNVEDALTTQALDEFQARAQQIAQALGRSGYRLVRLSVNSGRPSGPPVAYRAAMVADAAMKAAPAQLDGGEQTLSVSVSGTIQLDPPR